MDEPLHCLVEIPKGSRSEYGRDVALRVVEESRARWREERS